LAQFKDEQWQQLFNDRTYQYAFHEEDLENMTDEPPPSEHEWTDEDVCPLPSFYAAQGLIGECIYPHLSINKAAKSKSYPDTLTYNQAMADGEDNVHRWEQEMKEEVEQLENLGSWIEIPIAEATGKVISSMWVFRRKRKPDGTLYKYKGRLTFMGNLEDKTGDKETYASVASWSTV
jgi:ATP-dependent exoDNAse (exonuclease V) beta subunit